MIMLTKAEIRFIENWREQKSGPKWQYYLQYIIAWSVVIFLVLFFLLKIILEDKSMGGLKGFYIITGSAILLAVLTTHLLYTLNEKRYLKILGKEKLDNNF